MVRFCFFKLVVDGSLLSKHILRGVGWAELGGDLRIAWGDLRIASGAPQNATKMARVFLTTSREKMVFL